MPPCWGRKAVRVADLNDFATAVGTLIKNNKGEKGDPGPYGGTEVTDPHVAALLTSGAETAPILAAKVGKGELTLSVADFPTPEAAIEAAHTSGAPLYWPPGRWATNTVIPNLHKVRNSGPGQVSRGSNVLSIDPSDTAVNTLYVAPEGSDSNDGITAGYPFATFQAAFDALSGYGPTLRGSWTIQAAAGTYLASTGQQTLTTQSKNRVVIKGPTAGHPNVPTAIIDGTGGTAYKHGLSASGLGVKAEFRDLKFIGFSAGGGDASRIGVLGENESSVLFTNIHADGASWCGAYAFNTVRARVNGGVFTGCRSGFIANDTQCTVENTIVRSSTEAGIYWSRGSQGHVDHCTFEDNAIGLMVGESSRVDTVANNFKRNSYGIRTTNGGVYGEGGAKNQYNLGTPDAQIQSTVQHFVGSGDSTIRGSAYGWMRIGGSRSNVAHTGTTAPTDLVTSHTIPAGMLTQQTSIRIFGVISAATGGSLWVTFGGNTVTMPLPTVGASTPFEAEVSLMDSQGGHRSFGRLIAGATSRVVSGSGAVSSATEVPIRVGATLAAVSDIINVVRTDVSVL